MLGLRGIRFLWLFNFLFLATGYRLPRPPVFDPWSAKNIKSLDLVNTSATLDTELSKVSADIRVWAAIIENVRLLL